MAVKTTVTELPESRVRLAVEVPPEEVERRVHQTARELGSRLRIPGFRRGKVPPPVVIRRLGREALVEEAVRDGLPRWYQQAIDEAGITPVGDPELDVSDHPDEGQPLRFSIEIGVRPQARLGAYKGLEVGRREPRADPELVDRELEALRDRLATLEQVDRPAQEGDFVIVDYTGSADGEELEGAEGRDQLLELGTGRLLPGFDEQLLGASAGDQRQVEVTFPDDHPEHLRGRTATFEVGVKEVQAKRLPELDDEFASEAAGFDTLQELRDDVSQRLREADESTVEREFEQAVVEAAVEHAEIEVPENLVHARAHELISETLSALERQGISREAYLRIAGGDVEHLAHEAEPEARAALQARGRAGRRGRRRGHRAHRGGAAGGARAAGGEGRAQARASAGRRAPPRSARAVPRGRRDAQGARAAGGGGQTDPLRAGARTGEALDAGEAGIGPGFGSALDPGERRRWVEAEPLRAEQEPVSKPPAHVRRRRICAGASSSLARVPSRYATLTASSPA